MREQRLIGDGGFGSYNCEYLFEVPHKVSFDFIFEFAFDDFITEVLPKLEGLLADPQIIVVGELQNNVEQLKANILIE